MTAMELPLSYRTGSSAALLLTPANAIATLVVIHGAGNDRRAEYPFHCDRPTPMAAVSAILNRSWAGVQPDVPLLVVQGRRDAVALLAETWAWVGQAQARGAPIRLSVLPRVGHLDVMLSPLSHATVLGWVWDRLAEFP